MQNALFSLKKTPKNSKKWLGYWGGLPKALLKNFWRFDT
jgi:hypothetical protein